MLINSDFFNDLKKVDAVGFEAILNASNPVELYRIMAEYHKVKTPNRLPHHNHTVFDALSAWAEERGIMSKVSGDCVTVKTRNGTWKYERFHDGKELQQFIWD